MLVDSPVGFLRVSPLVLVPIALATAAITVFLVGEAIRAHRRRAITGSEGLLREQAVADETFASKNGSYVGVVRIHGELWRAVSQAPIAADRTRRSKGERVCGCTCVRWYMTARIETESPALVSSTEHPYDAWHTKTDARFLL